ncbi:ATP-binding cassette domain-containing protein, partial [bacterium]|nr:ATP-binding cassette domain-containing protein [bacterium]
MQRVLIARALAVEPKILILDEPTASVDSASKTRIYDLLKELNQEMTILIVTHDLSSVSSKIDKIACLN